MSRTVGVVIPAFRPDPARLREYLSAVRSELDPAVVRVELDAPVGDAPSLPDWVQRRVVRRQRGKGGAITDGFEELNTDVLAFADADGATPADSLARVIEPVIEGAVALSVGSRRHPDATIQSHQTFARRLLGDGFAWLGRRLTRVPLYDFQCGAKAITADAWEEVSDHLYEPGFAWDIELIAVTDALGYAIREVPVEWEDQPGSNVDPIRDTFDMARGMLAARHRARLLSDDRFHRLIAREDDTALVDRSEPDHGREPQ